MPCRSGWVSKAHRLQRGWDLCGVHALWYSVPCAQPDCEPDGVHCPWQVFQATHDFSLLLGPQPWTAPVFAAASGDCSAAQILCVLTAHTASPSENSIKLPGKKRCKNEFQPFCRAAFLFELAAQHHAFLQNQSFPHKGTKMQRQYQGGVLQERNGLLHATMVLLQIAQPMRLETTLDASCSWDAVSDIDPARQHMNILLRQALCHTILLCALSSCNLKHLSKLNPTYRDCSTGMMSRKGAAGRRLTQPGQHIII